MAEEGIKLSKNTMEKVKELSKMINPPKEDDEEKKEEHPEEEEESQNPVMSFFQKMTIGGYMQIMNDKFSDLT